MLKQLSHNSYFCYRCKKIQSLTKNKKTGSTRKCLIKHRYIYDNYVETHKKVQSKQELLLGSVKINKTNIYIYIDNLQIVQQQQKCALLHKEKLG